MEQELLARFSSAAAGDSKKESSPAASAIDWSTPGSALHHHLQMQHLTGGDFALFDEAQAQPSSRTESPPKSASKQQKPRISTRNRAERGPQFAFGGKVVTSKANKLPRMASVDLSGPSGVSVRRDKRLGAQKKADPWLGDWQPKSKPSTPEPRKLAQRKSFSVLLTPPLGWDVPRQTQAESARPAQDTGAAATEQTFKDSGGSFSPSKEKPEKGKSRTPARKRVPDSTGTKGPTSSTSTPSTTKSAHPMDSPKQSAASQAEPTPKEAAMKRLAGLRNARRLQHSRASVSESPPPVQGQQGSGSIQEVSSCNAHPAPQQSKPRQPEGRNGPQANLSGKPALKSQGSLLSRTKRALQGRVSSFRKQTSAMNSPLPADAPQQSLDSAAAVKLSGLPAEPEEVTKLSTLSDAGDSTEPQELIQCDGCGRNFNAAAFSKHSKICAKVFKAARAAYAAEKAAKLSGAATSDPKSCVGSSEAPQGTRVSISMVADRASSAPAGRRQKPSAKAAKAVEVSAKKVPKWKQQSSQLRAAMLAARPNKLGQAAAAFPGAVPKAEEDLRIPCPHCGRRFAELTAERHIPKCKETRNKAAPLKAGGGKAAHMRQRDGGSLPGRKW